jgi:hypothetical protein
MLCKHNVSAIHPVPRIGDRIGPRTRRQRASPPTRAQIRLATWRAVRAAEGTRSRLAVRSARPAIRSASCVAPALPVLTYPRTLRSGSRRALLGAASGGSKRLAGRAFWGRERVRPRIIDSDLGALASIAAARYFMDQLLVRENRQLANTAVDPMRPAAAQVGVGRESFRDFASGQ